MANADLRRRNVLAEVAHVRVCTLPGSSVNLV